MRELEIPAGGIASSARHSYLDLRGRLQASIHKSVTAMVVTKPMTELPLLTTPSKTFDTVPFQPPSSSPSPFHPLVSFRVQVVGGGVGGVKGYMSSYLIRVHRLTTVSSMMVLCSFSYSQSSSGGFSSFLAFRRHVGSIAQMRTRPTAAPSSRNTSSA
jgi:hypothetical protein